MIAIQITSSLIRGCSLRSATPRRDKRGVDLISGTFPLRSLVYGEPNAIIGYAKFFSRSHDAETPVFDIFKFSRHFFSQNLRLLWRKRLIWESQRMLRV